MVVQAQPITQRLEGIQDDGEMDELLEQANIGDVGRSASVHILSTVSVPCGLGVVIAVMRA